MLITEKEALKKYQTSKRLWQGIPSIEVTKKGRIFVTFYSGGTREEIGNYVLLLMSDDGVNFSEPIAAAYEEKHRCFDPCLWIDPLGRLWLTWTRYPDDGLFAVVCDDPDADELTFGEEFFVGNNVMMDKPTVLRTGEWMFPIAVWRDHLTYDFPGFGADIPEKGSYVYVTEDNGKTFRKLGHADVKRRCFDEHQILEMKDGTLRMFVRTTYGIGAANSYDGGKSWSEDFDTGYGGPSSRFHIRRLRSGRVLLINHYQFNGRNNMTAMLSEDDGKTFPYTLLLDERKDVSYPDAKEAEDGFIYITYDRERGGYKSNMKDVMDSAREILMAKITEDDILQGRLVNTDSELKRVVSKLTDYEGEVKNPFEEEALFNDMEYAQYLDKLDDVQKIIARIFNAYSLNCIHLHNLEAEKLDELIRQYSSDKKLSDLSAIVSLVRSASPNACVQMDSIVADICAYINTNLERDCNAQDIARQFNISSNYLMHIFKKYTGTTVMGYRNAQRIIKAKILLRNCDEKITDIAAECGYDNSSYFSEIFKKEVGMSPSQWREMGTAQNEKQA